MSPDYLFTVEGTNWCVKKHAAELYQLYTSLANKQIAITFPHLCSVASNMRLRYTQYNERIDNSQSY